MIRRQKPTGLVKTARGQYIDMNKLAGFNEEAVAVTAGGVAMNARGDILGKSGKVIKTREQLEQAYAVSLENATSHISDGAHSEEYETVSIRKVAITPDEIKDPKKSSKVKEEEIEEVSLEDIDSLIEKNRKDKK